MKEQKLEKYRIAPSRSTKMGMGKRRDPYFHNKVATDYVYLVSV